MMGWRFRVNRKKRLFQAASLAVITVLVFAAASSILSPHASATTSGRSKLYFHQAPTDYSSTYNSLTLTPDEMTNNLQTATDSTTSTSNPPTALCNSNGNTAGNYNAISVDGTSTGYKCIGSFISMPVGTSISMASGDGSMTGSIWISVGSNKITAAGCLAVYKLGSMSSAIASACSSGTSSGSPTNYSLSLTPSTASLAATDRIVVIAYMDITASWNHGNGNNATFYFDNSSDSSTLTMSYALSTPNKPSLAGSLDDDFTAAQATSSCSTSGAAFNTKWTCLQGSASGSAGNLNDGGTNASPSGGDSSNWLWLQNQVTTNSVALSNFGTTPSNTFLYQTLPGDYGDGNVRTVIDASSEYLMDSNSSSFSPSSPYNHAGIVLWSGNTDYLEIYTYQGTGGTHYVAFTNSGGSATTASITAFQRVWLGFSDTGGSYQAQYSTDGSTWNNLGTAVTHDAFLRVGLSVFDGTVNSSLPSSNYGAAFDWFQSTLTSATYNQDAYKWAGNQDNTVPTSLSPGSSNNTPYTLTSAGEQFRLRLALQITGQSNQGNSPPQFKLRFIGRGTGTCASPSGGTPSTWTDVTTSTVISYYNNPTPADGANTSASSGNDPTGGGTNVYETYEEANNFSATNNNLNNGNDGIWDFSLYDNGATAGTTYCFKVTDSSNTDIASYTNRPEITTYTSFVAPTTDQLLRGGEYFSGGTKQPFYWAQ